ncbi:hypothetical protein AVEN_110244-1 [Araneus ventricosus]|uniref:Uncharacterized protein n=1 Tax=Araneus ventricosus TaxID=182803 RepID=A0A4Y2SND2_ARAVE|nr:hypothetical protein AVEN_110244-1 [Araneus ventricosus]
MVTSVFIISKYIKGLLKCRSIRVIGMTAAAIARVPSPNSLSPGHSPIPPEGGTYYHWRRYPTTGYISLLYCSPMDSSRLITASKCCLVLQPECHMSCQSLPWKPPSPDL